MTATIQHIGSPTVAVKSWTAADVTLDVSAEAVQHVVSGDLVSEETIGDSVWTTYASAVVDTHAQIVASEPCSYRSLNEAIATVDTSGFVERVSNGTVGIICTTPQGSKRLNVTVSRSAPGPATNWTRFADGTLGKHVCDAVDNRLAGKTPSVAKPLYSTLDHNTPQYARNADCWATVDLSSVSPYNQTQPTRYTGTLITPLHCVFANHFQLPLNVPVRWITPDNQIVERQLVSKSRVGLTDVMIGRLNAPVPSSISFCKILPSNWYEYLPGYTHGLPGIGSDQQRKALVTEFYSLLGDNVVCKAPVDWLRFEFYETIVSGDSGNPFGLLVNDEFVLLSCWSGGGAGAGPAYMQMIGAINAKLDELGPGGYTLTTIDLSGFPAFEV